ncbi:hypothetical protein KKF84_10680 [Myxococcota bacterium]|nr:hypothetical protein [Myxococcota bacterium]
MRLLFAVLTFSLLGFAPTLARADAGDRHTPFIFHIQGKKNIAAKHLTMTEVVWDSFVPVRLHSLIPIRPHFIPELLASLDGL